MCRCFYDTPWTLPVRITISPIADQKHSHDRETALTHPRVRVRPGAVTSLSQNAVW